MIRRNSAKRCMNNIRNSARCYLCNCAFLDKKVYEHMFEKRFNVNGIEQDTLASILSTVLGDQLQEKLVHSTNICSTCKVSLLNYEALARQLFQLRLEIIQTHKQTTKLYESNVINDSNTKSMGPQYSMPSDSEQSSEDDDEDDNEYLFEQRCVDFQVDEQCFQDMEEVPGEPTDAVEQCYEDLDLIKHYPEDLNLLEKSPEDLDSIEQCSQDLDFIEHCSEDLNLVERCSIDTELFNEEESGMEQVCRTSSDSNQKEARGSKKRHGRHTVALKEFPCSYCGKVCDRRIRLVEHERIHTGERPFKCEECGLSFAQRANWRSHLNTTHLQVANFKCNECGRNFKRRRLLDNHIKSVHTKLRDLSCEHCEATFSNPITLKKHLLCHTGDKNYNCQICGKQFSRAENRNVHHFVHSITKPYACDVCGEGFMRKQQLIQHSRVTKHFNPKIVRLKPQFSAANSDKLLLQRIPAAKSD